MQKLGKLSIYHFIHCSVMQTVNNHYKKHFTGSCSVVVLILTIIAFLIRRYATMIGCLFVCVLVSLFLVHNFMSFCEENLYYGAVCHGADVPQFSVVHSDLLQYSAHDLTRPGFW